MNDRSFICLLRPGSMQPYAVASVGLSLQLVLVFLDGLFKGVVVVCSWSSLNAVEEFGNSFFLLNGCSLSMRGVILCPSDPIRCVSPLRSFFVKI